MIAKSGLCSLTNTPIKMHDLPPKAINLSAEHDRLNILYKLSNKGFILFGLPKGQSDLNSISL